MSLLLVCCSLHLCRCADVLIQVSVSLSVSVSVSVSVSACACACVCVNLSIRNSIIVYGCRYGGGVDRRHAALARCLADIIHSHSGVKVFIEQEVSALTRVVNGQTEHARMDLVFNLTVQSRIWTSLSLLPSLAIRPWCLLPAKNQDLWPRERRRPNSTGTHTSIWSRSFLRQLVDLVHMPGNSLTICCEMLTTHQLLSETLGPPSKVCFTVPSPNNNSWQLLRDSWGLLSQPFALYIWYLWLLVPDTRERTQPISVSRPLQQCHVALL